MLKNTIPFQIDSTQCEFKQLLEYCLIRLLLKLNASLKLNMTSYLLH